MGTGSSRTPSPDPSAAIIDEMPADPPVQGPRTPNFHWVKQPGGMVRVDGEAPAPRLARLVGYDPSIYPDSDPHQGDHIGHDYVHDDEDPSRLGAEAAYCRAAAESYADSHTPDDPGVAGTGSAPFKGQGSVMYSYRESGKMRFGTLNVKGSLQGATGVSCHCLQFPIFSDVYGVHVIVFFPLNRSFPLQWGGSL